MKIILNIKPAISWLRTETDGNVIIITGDVLTAMTDNPYFVTPPPDPDLSIIKAAWNGFVAAEQAAAGGGMLLTSLKRARRQDLVVLMQNLALYLTKVCRGNMPALLSSKYPTQKPMAEPIGELPAPGNLILNHGLNRGNIDASVDPVFGASSYNWRMTANTPGAMPLLVSNTTTYISFTGLTAGVFYTIEAQCVGAAGTSGWSTPVTLVAD